MFWFKARRKSVDETPTILTHRSDHLFCSCNVHLVSWSHLTGREAGKCCAQLGSYGPNCKYVTIEEGGKDLGETLVVSISGSN